MVCARCGCALGIGQQPLSRRAAPMRPVWTPRGRRMLVIGLLLAVSAALAALSERGGTPGTPDAPRLIPDRSWRSDGRPPGRQVLGSVM